LKRETSARKSEKKDTGEIKELHSNKEVKSGKNKIRHAE
jgi:hypothetical protein